MSRFDIPAHLSTLAVTVGWDEPMQTFFAQVERVSPGDDDDDLVLWLGKDPGEIADPMQINRLLVPYATLTEAQIAMLQKDRAESEPVSQLLQIMQGIKR